MTPTLGSILGPVVGTRLMASFDIDGVLYFMAAMALVLAAASYRSLRVPPPRHQERPFDLLTPQASSLAHVPRG